MGKGGVDPTSYRSESYYQPRRVSTRRSEELAKNVTTDAVDGLPFPPASSASQSQNPPGSSVAVKKPRRLAGQATKIATSGVPNPDSKALDVQLHEALLHGNSEDSHGVTRDSITAILRWVPSLDYNLIKILCKYFLRTGEKAGKSSSKGNLAESSDSTFAKRKEQWVSKKLTGVRQRNNAFVSEIRLPGKKHKVWLGTYKTKEEAGQAFQVAADWREAHRGSKSFSEEEVHDLQKRAKKAGEHLSDDRSHHNVASPAATVASSKGKAMASAERVSQRKSPAHQNASSPDWETLSDLEG